MIPNLTIIIAAYVLVRLLATVVKVASLPKRNFGHGLVAVAAIVAAVMVWICTSLTIAAGSHTNFPNMNQVN